MKSRRTINQIHICYIRNEHNAVTEIHAFLEGPHSTVAVSCGVVKNGANDPPRPTTQPFYGFEQRLCTLLYVTLEDRFTSIRDLAFSTTQNFLFFFILHDGLSELTANAFGLFS